MSLASVFNIAGSGMSAQSTRLNTVASNIANAETVSSSVDKTYRARHPVFSTMFQQAQGDSGSLFADQDSSGAPPEAVAANLPPRQPVCEECLLQAKKRGQALAER